jgi:hypothetical protein
MIVNIDHLPYYDYITNSTAVMTIDNSTYQLTNGGAVGSIQANPTFSNTTAK